MNNMEKIKKMNLEEFRVYANEMHKKRGYKYDEYEYSFHTNMVRKNVKRFAHLLPPHIKEEDMEMAADGHDLIEDCGVTYNDIKRRTNKVVANLILAVSNVPGEDRVERFFLTAPKIRKSIGAMYLKNCDTMANMSHGKRTGNSMFEKYKSEHVIYKYAFYNKSKSIFQEMWDEFDKIINDEEYIPASEGSKKFLPKNLDECIEILKKETDVGEVKSWASMSEKKASALAHHQVGRHLRNDWGLWGGEAYNEESTAIHKWFNGLGIKHGDDISGIILTSFYRVLNNKPIKLEKQLETYWNYWTFETPSDNCNPLNIKGIEEKYLNLYKKFIKNKKKNYVHNKR